jgi:rod shape determining protein RodA
VSHEFVRQLPRHEASLSRPTLATRLHLDLPLLLGLLLIAAGGLLVLFSAGNEQTDLVIRQSVRFGFGFAALFILAQLPPRSFRFWAPVLYGIGLAMLMLVEILGIEAKGAQRWLTLPLIGQFQPAELMKVALPMMLAWFFHEKKLPPRYHHLLIAVVVTLVPVLLVAIQPDLGTALLILFSGTIILFLAGLSWRLILTAFVLVAIVAPLMYYFVLHDYQRQRIDTFLNPESDPLGAGWNIIQSKTAIGSGGIFGKGWLNGTQSRLDFLPESTTDFIFAVLAEEFGLVGILLLLTGYLFVIGRCLWISSRSQDTFSRLLSACLTLTFFIYAFINIGMVSGLLPVVGVPLPLISYGGTSIVTLLSGFGIIMSIATHRRLLN